MSFILERQVLSNTAYGPCKRRSCRRRVSALKSRKDTSACIVSIIYFILSLTVLAPKKEEETTGEETTGEETVHKIITVTFSIVSIIVLVAIKLWGKQNGKTSGTTSEITAAATAAATAEVPAAPVTNPTATSGTENLNFGKRKLK